MTVSETFLPIGLLGILVIMLIPLPGYALDLLLAGNLSITILLLLVTMGAKRALDLSVFPSLLLLLTLYRLSLNVATTRSILLNANAGKLVEAFGDFVVGGDLVVGLVIFLILVVIQFVVITKGAGRISEVAARFTLDALPGKQMAIDAELNAGAIDEAAAKVRRDQLAQETEFYGAMDGASKFVRGDAIAGMIITAINLVGGVILGMTHGMGIVDSITRYSVLTVGDGLISQIPALIIAVTAGILVTKSNTAETLSEELESQLFKNQQPLWIGVVILGLLAMMPGMPRIPFLAIAIGLLIFLSKRRVTATQSKTPQPDAPAESDQQNEDQIGEFLLKDRATIEVGARLVTLMNPSRGKTLAERITALRKDFSKERGLWIPPIRVRSQIQMEPSRYRILIAGRVVATGELNTTKVLAILPENPGFNIPGEDTVEPAFQLPAKWIDPSLTQQAETHRFTVVDPVSVLITHLGEVLKQYGHELLTRETLKELLDRVREFAPTIVDELRSESVRMAVLHQVLQQLAEDAVPLSDLVLVLESVSNSSGQNKTANELTDAVRRDLGRLICERYCSSTGELRVIAFEPRLEAQLREQVRDQQLAIGPEALDALIQLSQTAWKDSQRADKPLALLVDSSLRRTIRKLLRRSAPQLGIISFQEVPSEIGIEPVQIIQWQQVFNEEQPATTVTPTTGNSVSNAA
jgi:flagellar biosynthesis protein FlhA